MEASFSVTFSVMAKKSVHETLKLVYEKKKLEKHTKKANFFVVFLGKHAFRPPEGMGCFVPLKLVDTHFSNCS